jgi:hypothetical protein
MARACKLGISRAELIELMSGAVDWEVLRHNEAQQLHRRIVDAANLVVLAAPGVLKDRRALG